MEEVRRWYRTSSPEMGYQVEHRVFGFYSRNLNTSHPGTNQVFVWNLAPKDIPVFLADAAVYFQNQPVKIWVDNRDADSNLGSALLAAKGCTAGSAEVFLAHTGDVPPIPSVRGLTIDPVTSASMLDYAVTHAKGFANSEVEPDLHRIEEIVSLRKAEMAGEGRFLLARMQAEPAGIISWYEGIDRFVFALATRVPFRGRGIAKVLLCHVLSDSNTRGCRSVIINANPTDTPINLYRSLGFVDEVYWRRFYIFVPLANGDPAT